MAVILRGVKFEHSIGSFSPLGTPTERYAYVKVQLPYGEATEAEMWALARALEEAASGLLKSVSAQGKLAL